jgi:predicted transcriptional regulator
LDDEYTPEQHRIIDARLAEGLTDIKAGRVYGPFETHEAVMELVSITNWYIAGYQHTDLAPSPH